MSFNFEDRVSAYPNRYLLTAQDGSQSYIILERADEPTVAGTPLNAETFNGLVEWLQARLDILTFEVESLKNSGTGGDANDDTSTTSALDAAVLDTMVLS